MDSNAQRSSHTLRALRAEAVEFLFNMISLLNLKYTVRKFNDIVLNQHLKDMLCYSVCYLVRCVTMNTVYYIARLHIFIS